MSSHPKNKKPVCTNILIEFFRPTRQTKLIAPPNRCPRFPAYNPARCHNRFDIDNIWQGRHQTVSFKTSSFGAAPNSPITNYTSKKCGRCGQKQSCFGRSLNLPFAASGRQIRCKCGASDRTQNQKRTKKAKHQCFACISIELNGT